MRLNYFVAKPFLLAALAIFVACHDDDKPHPEHEGEGQLVVTVENPGSQALTLRVFGESLDEPLETRFKAEETTGALDAWLVAGAYDALVTPDTSGEVVIEDTASFSTAIASVRIPEGSEMLPSVSTPVYAAVRSGITLAEGETNRLTLTPKDIRKILRLTVSASDGLITGPIKATLEGIASKINLASGETNTPAILGFTLPAPDTDNSSCTTAGILGVVKQEKTDTDLHLLTLTWKTAEGKEQAYYEDVSAQLYRAIEAGADTIYLAVKAQINVPIRLYTGIQTRALVDEFNKTPVSIAAGTATGQYTEIWDGVASGGEIKLTPERYYPVDGTPVCLRGYYPAAPLENGGVHYALTGQEDLMLSDEQKGSLSNRFSAAKTPLTYQHLLVQLSFKLSLKGVNKEYRVRSVKLSGLAAEARVDLASGAIQPIGQGVPVVIYSDPGTGGFPITGGMVTLPGYVLVQPEAVLALDLVLNVDNNPANDKVFTNLPVHFSGGAEGGSAYEVEVSLELPDDPDEPDEPDEPDNPDNPNPPDNPDPEPPVIPDPDNGIQVKVRAKITVWKKGDSGGIVV